jgi:WD40 repeat protein
MHRVLARKAIVYGLLLICLLISCAVLLSSLRWSASPQPAWTVAWSPNGQVLAVGYGGYGNSGDTLPVDQDTRVRLWNLAQLSQPPISLDASPRRVLILAWSPDGKTLAACSEFAPTRIWDLQDLQQSRLLPEPPRSPPAGSSSLAFSPDAHWLAASGGLSEAVILWNMHHPADPVFSAAHPPIMHPWGATFLPDNQTLVIGDGPGRVWFWSLHDPQALPTPLPTQGAGVYIIAVSVDGQKLAGAGRTPGDLRVWALDHSQ